MSSSRTPIDPPRLEGYRHLSFLGSGGFSDVFLYERVFPRQKVAIKVLVGEHLGPAGRERFTAEANAMAALSTHPFIVTIYEAATSPEGYPYLAMEYYPKANFNVRARTERFSVPSVLRAGVQLASAVETAHRNGVLHRDIKPANVLTSEYGRPGLADFGIAVAQAEDREAEAEGLSIPWSPPEVLAGDGATDERADVYSLGATLYTLLAGRSPFEVVGGENRGIDLIDRIERQPVPVLERAEVPASLLRLLVSTMSKDPGGRPASAAELGRALQRIEVEEHFDMTPFEVSEDGEEAPTSASGSEEIDAEAGETRIRGARTIEAQPRPAAAPRREHDRPFKGHETVMRTSLRAPRAPAPPPATPAAPSISATPYVPGRPATTRSASGPTAAPATRSATTAPAAADYAGVAAVTPSPERPAVIAARTGWKLPGNLVMSVLVAVLAVVVGSASFFVSGGGASSAEGDGGTTETTVEARPEAPLQVTATFEQVADTKQWTVTWTVADDHEPSDTFEVQYAREVEEVRGTDRKFTFELDQTQPCISVIVVRGDLRSDPETTGDC